MGNTEHLEIGKLINEKTLQNCKIIKDKACGENQRLPLFCSDIKSRMTEYCNVDILILFRQKIKVIIEIDVSDIKPTQICGKFLTAALSTHYIHGSQKFEMADSVLFIQIVSMKKLKEETSKSEQFINIEKSIQTVIPLEKSNITKYQLLQFEENYKRIEKSLINTINNHLNS